MVDPRVREFLQQLDPRLVVLRVHDLNDVGKGVGHDRHAVGVGVDEAIQEGRRPLGFDLLELIRRETERCPAGQPQDLLVLVHERNDAPNS